MGGIYPRCLCEQGGIPRDCVSAGGTSRTPSPTKVSEDYESKDLSRKQASQMGGIYLRYLCE